MDTKIAEREVFYLARVGAYRYLDASAAILGYLGVPLDEGVEPCARKCCNRSSNLPRRGVKGSHGLGAFQVYAETENTLLEALRGCESDELEQVAKRLGDGLAEGEQLRANLLRKGHPVPGRGRWLVSEGAS